MGMTRSPRRVSVIVPTYNRAPLLRQALASIRRLEGDAFTFEILVGDNGCSDATRTVCDEFGAEYIPVTRHGAGAARNAALRAATGDYLAFLDDDDVWLPTHLSAHFALLDARPEVDAVIGQVIYATHDLATLSAPFPDPPPHEGEPLLKAMLSGFFPQIGTTIARARVREKFGEFDEELIGGQDLDWLLRIARNRSLAFAVTPCLWFRARPYGTYDALQLKRVKFDRTVFLRHAVPEWRIWRSPFAFLKAYTGTLRHFFDYFVDAAAHRAGSGDRRGSTRALIGAFSVFPLRTLYYVIAPKPLRAAVLSIVFPRRGAVFPIEAHRDGD
jgi:glycosyltransferase involved in cell wall biosynthesis